MRHVNAEWEPPVLRSVELGPCGGVGNAEQISGLGLPAEPVCSSGLFRFSYTQVYLLVKSVGLMAL